MFADPSPTCTLCPRLAQFRADNTAAHPDWFNGPVPAFGDLTAELLIVGLAPGLKGANLTGRPFTGDYAGDLLYATLAKFGLAQGAYDKHAGDGLRLVNCRVTNAVRCVPPQNKPTGPETRTCNEFLGNEITAMEKLRVILTLGGLSHGAVLQALGHRKSAFKFAHLAQHDVGSGVTMVNSYHCSRYNTNTGRLTVPMFEDVFTAMRPLLSA